MWRKGSAQEQCCWSEVHRKTCPYSWEPTIQVFPRICPDALKSILHWRPWLAILSSMSSSRWDNKESGDWSYGSLLMGASSQQWILWLSLQGRVLLVTGDSNGPPARWGVELVSVLSMIRLGLILKIPSRESISQSEAAASFTGHEHGWGDRASGE